MSYNSEHLFGGTAALLEIIDTIYAAVERPELWEPVFARIAAALQGESIALFADFPDFRTPNILAKNGLRQDAWDVFVHYYAAISPLIAQGEQVFTTDQTWFGHIAVPDAELERTEFYNDFCKPNHIHNTVGLRILVPGASTASLSCQRPASAGAFGAHADGVLQTLKPHLRRALILHNRLGVLQAGALGIEAALNAHDRAVLGIDAARRVVFINRSAESLLSAGKGIRLVNGHLTCASIEDQGALSALLAGAVGDGFAGGSIPVRHRLPDPPIILSVTPFRHIIAGYPDPLAALVFLTDPATPTRSRAATLRTVYRLTPTECRIADFLAAGSDLREVSAQLGITFETARYHVKGILAKTGARRQSDVIRLVLALPSHG